MNFGIDMVFLFLLALVLFGPKKLAEISKVVGKAMNDFKRASAEFQTQLQDEIRQLEYKEQQSAAKTAENTVLAPAEPSPSVPAATPEGAIPQNGNATPEPQFESCAEVVMPPLPKETAEDVSAETASAEAPPVTAGQGSNG
jgi:sec-independent protein translocase protein TatB